MRAFLRVYDRGMKWEYKTITVSIRGLLEPNVETEVVDRTLNRLGREGWELVSAFDTNIGSGKSCEMVAIFKRPREKDGPA